MMPSRRTETLWLFGFFAGIILCACLFTPVLFWLGRNLIPGFFPLDGHETVLGGIRDDLIESPFSRYFNRTLTLAAIALIFPCAKGLKLGKSGDKKTLLGLRAGRKLPLALTLAFVLGGASLLLLGWRLTEEQLLLLKPGETFWKGDYAGAFVTGWGVGLIEEILFRGVLLGIFLSLLRPWPAVIITSLIFAAVHFVKVDQTMEISDLQVTWNSGFVLFSRMLGGFGDYRFLLADFATLLVVGLTLGWFRLVTGAVWGAAALHAGWVFGLKYTADLVRSHRVVTREQLMPFLGDTLKSGVIPLTIIALTWLILRIYWPQNAGGIPLTRRPLSLPNVVEPPTMNKPAKKRRGIFRKAAKIR